LKIVLHIQDDLPILAGPPFQGNNSSLND